MKNGIFEQRYQGFRYILDIRAQISGFEGIHPGNAHRYNTLDKVTHIDTTHWAQVIHVDTTHWIR